MSAEVAVVVPTLGRPHRVQPVLSSFTDTAPAHVLFIADPNDEPTITALRQADAHFMLLDGNYARKIRCGIEETYEPLVFTGGDDLDALPGWFDRAKRRLTGNKEVVGLNDLIKRNREHATHFLMTRAYALQPTADQQPGPFYDGYHHWYMDDEFIGTAMHRGVYAYAPDAKIKHLHPMAGLAGEDDTYRKGMSQTRIDRKKFKRRMHLWT